MLIKWLICFDTHTLANTYLVCFPAIFIHALCSLIRLLLIGTYFSTSTGQDEELNSEINIYVSCTVQLIRPQRQQYTELYTSLSFLKLTSLQLLFLRFPFIMCWFIRWLEACIISSILILTRSSVQLRWKKTTTGTL